MPQTIQVKLDLRTNPDFRLVVPERKVEVVAGTNAVYYVTADGLGTYNDDVDLSATSLPANATSTIGEDPIGSDGTTTVTIGTTGVSAGTHEFYIGGATWTPAENIRWAASPSLADVQSAINAADDGDIVYVPAGDGSETWASQLLITKGIKLIGPGKSNLTISISHSTYVIQYTPAVPANDNFFRISGFTFNCTGGNGIRFYTTSTTPQTQIRVDNNTITGASSPISTYGLFWGVIDSNTFTGMTVQSILGGSAAMGLTHWANQTYNFGTTQQLYFEDNTVTTNQSFVGSCGFGARYCVRYNTITGIGVSVHSMLDIHGNQSTGQGHNGGMGIEVYSNTFNTGNLQGGPFWDYRGGRGLFYSNNSVGTAVNLRPYIREEYVDSYWADPPVNAPAFALSSDPDIYAERGQPLHPSGAYMFLNRQNGTTNMPFVLTSTVDYSGQADEYKCFAGEAIVPTENIHFWQEQASFDGSVGVGVGTLASRPASCTGNGVAWWATDESKLYRWKTGTGWELFYTPYTYPHPLRSV